VVRVAFEGGVIEVVVVVVLDIVVVWNSPFGKSKGAVYRRGSRRLLEGEFGGMSCFPPERIEVYIAWTYESRRAVTARRRRYSTSLICKCQ
jgi:hypothetical protein